MSDAGSLIGFVGDLGFGLTKPVPDAGEIWIGGGFLALEDGVLLCDSAAGVVFLGVATGAGFLAATDGPDPADLGSRGRGLARGLLTVGDLVGGFTEAFVADVVVR